MVLRGKVKGLLRRSSPRRKDRRDGDSSSASDSKLDSLKLKR